MTVAEYAQVALLWAATNLPLWQRPAIGLLALFVVGLVLAAHAVVTRP